MQIPIYQLIENEIKNKIKSKELSPGDLIPSENQLKDQFNVSRMTVRQALNNLVNEGFLYKHKGKGTFVSNRKIEKNIHGVRGFTEEMESMGKTVRSEVISFEEIIPSKEIQEKLFLEDNEEVYYIIRIRYGDDIPVLHEKLFIPKTLFKDLSKADLEVSFYTYVQDTMNFKISHCIQSIEAKIGSKEINNSLEITKEQPVLSIVRNTFLNNGRPFEYVISTYRSDQYRFVQYAAKS